MRTENLPLWLLWLGAFGLGLAACGWLDETTVERRE
jgi:hypothetical protein